MRPHQWLLPDKTPLGLLAQFGSSRVREDPPRLVREVGLSRTNSANLSPAPTDTNVVRRYRSMRCGRGKRDLGSPRTAIPSVRIHRTPRIGIDQSSFSSREKYFSHRGPTPSPANPPDSLCGDETYSVWSGSRGLPRGTAQPSRSRYTRARSRPAGGPEKPRGRVAAAADLPNHVASESAARVDSTAASPKPTRIRAIRRIQRWGVRGAPYHPLRWS
jgi:hypothetical protein